MKLNEHFLAQMREATALLQSEGPQAATAAIQRALHGAAPGFASPHPGQHHILDQLDVLGPLPRAIHPEQTEEQGPDTAAARAGRPAWFQRLQSGWAGNMARNLVADVEDVEVLDAEDTDKGRFVSGSFSNAAGTRQYKLYIPSGYTGQPLPLVVMLHGCTQHPDDFAAGTGMNAQAEEQNFFVLYPAQSKTANQSSCWNWFQPGDQMRDRGEPSLIAGITRKIMREHKVDEARIFVAGLSAGGAMAAILGARYPDLYAAVGVHSGLPVGVARDVGSAFAAMKSRKGKTSPRAARAHPPSVLDRSVPLIVFHGDADRTVHSSNGEQLLQQYLLATGQEPSTPRSEQGSSSGRRYTRRLHQTGQGRVVAEHWTLHGAGHAWAGGSRKGSYTDPAGPDAAREMVRFFFSQPRG